MQGRRVIHKAAAASLGAGLLLTFAAAPAQAGTKTTESSINFMVGWTEYGETSTTVGNVRTGSLEVFTRTPYSAIGNLVSWNCPPGVSPLDSDGDDTGGCDIVQFESLRPGATLPAISGNGVGNTTLSGSLEAVAAVGGATRSVPVNITWNVLNTPPQRSTDVVKMTTDGVETLTITDTASRASTQTGTIAGVVLGDDPGDTVTGTLAAVSITVEIK